MNIPKIYKPQTEQQILARKEGRGLACSEMIKANLKMLLDMGWISQKEYDYTVGNMQITKSRIRVAMIDRMKVAGTWKEVNYDF